MDFKWEMQERIDAGMSDMDAYEATRDSYASIYDNRDKTEEVPRFCTNCDCEDTLVCKDE